MSASLVGSEMCIRDRPRKPTAPFPTHRERVGCGARAQAARALELTRINLPPLFSRCCEAHEWLL
eukprot:11792487-Alexandrium_andersonii.AAC.1